ncbi:OB-fold protein [Planctomicrobium sp. SH527]|uniref:OB-fold protein n=1 Tax=Planctomicrobium sp. SH527 TaxID=3448123 RepID=UPI003F5B521C
MLSNWYCSKEGTTQSAAAKVTSAVKQIDSDVSLWQEEESVGQARLSRLKRPQPDENLLPDFSAPSTHGRRRGGRISFGKIWQRLVDFFHAFVLFWTAGSPSISVRFSRFSNSSLSKSEEDRTQWLVIGTWFAPLLILGVMTLVLMQSSAVRKELIDAGALWEQGRKDEAGALYQSIIGKSGMFIPREQEGVVYGRVIDHLTQNNRREDARLLVEKLNRRGPSVPLQLETQSAQSLMAEVGREWVVAHRKNGADIGLPEFPLAEVDRNQFYNASGFYHIFNSNSVETDMTFTGTITCLIGVVDSIEFSPENGTIIHFVTNQHGEKGVQCVLSSTVANSDHIKTVKPGDYVKVRGRCEGKSHAGIVVMSHCDALIANED